MARQELLVDLIDAGFEEQLIALRSRDPPEDQYVQERWMQSKLR